MKKVHWVLIGSVVALVIVFAVGFGLQGPDFFTALVFRPVKIDVNNNGSDGGSGGRGNCTDDPSFTGSMPSPWVQLDSEKIISSPKNKYRTVIFKFDPIKLSQLRFVNSDNSNFYKVKGFWIYNSADNIIISDSRSEEPRCSMTYFGTSNLGSPNSLIKKVTIEVKRENTDDARMQLWGLPR